MDRLDELEAFETDLDDGPGSIDGKADWERVDGLTEGFRACGWEGGKAVRLRVVMDE